MSPQARGKLPPELGRLTRKDMEAVIYQANLGRENEKIAQLILSTSSRRSTLRQSCSWAAPRSSAACRRSCGRCSGLPANCITEISAEKSALIFKKIFIFLLTFAPIGRIIRP